MKCSKCGLDKEKIGRLVDIIETLSQERINRLEKLMDQKIELLKSI